jgi:DNA repair exonuclease SbcCD nuclease subunit
MIRATIGHVADLHITEGPRLADQIAALEEIARQGQIVGVQLWIVAGDLYGHTVPHRSTPAERLAMLQWLQGLTRDGARVVVIAGNHDDEVDLAGLAVVPGVEVATRAQRLTIDVGDALVDVLCLPYPWRRWLLADGAETLGSLTERAERALAALLTAWSALVEEGSHPRRFAVLAAHLHVTGGSLGAGVVSSTTELQLPAAALEAVGADYVALGHLHQRQVLGSEGRVWYAGSPWQTAHSAVAEHGPERGWNLVTLTRGAAVQADLDVIAAPSRARPLVTLTYRWADVDGSPAWSTRPDPADLAEVARGAEVRVRILTSAALASTCPWSVALDEVAGAGAERVVEERVVEPTYRRREILSADELVAPLPEQLRAYWSAVATPPSDAEQGRALTLLAELP